MIAITTIVVGVSGVIVGSFFTIGKFYTLEWWHFGLATIPFLVTLLCAIVILNEKSKTEKTLEETLHELQEQSDAMKKEIINKAGTT